MAIESNRCLVCPNQGDEFGETCNECGNVKLCSSKVTQPSVCWQLHQINGLRRCLPVSPHWDPLVGRCLLANRNISDQEVIFKENPFVVAPQSIPVCICCFRTIHNDPITKCSRCNLPTCSQSCSMVHESHR